MTETMVKSNTEPELDEELLAEAKRHLGTGLKARSTSTHSKRPTGELLTANVPTVVVLALDPADVPDVGGLARLSSLGVGHAAVAGTSLEAFIVTAEGASMRRLIADDWLVIDI